MKKIFSIISACLVGIILVFIVVTSFVKKNVTIAYGKPSGITVFDRSSVAIGKKTYEAGTKEYNKLLKEFEKVTNISVFNRLVNQGTLDIHAEQDLDDRISKWSTDMKLNNIVVELDFDNQQDAVIYNNGDSRVISYWALMFVIPTRSTFSEIIVYYSTTNDTTAMAASYQQCDPIVIQGLSKDFKSFLKSFASKVS